MDRYGRSRGGAGVALLIILGVLVVAVVGVGPIQSYGKHKHATVTVSDKQRVCDSGQGTCRYLVFTDRGTYRVSDSILFAGRVTSSDFYGRLRVCDRYNITTYGWRIGLLSEYQNIITATDLGHDASCTPTQ
jgi:hypothetical protein